MARHKWQGTSVKWQVASHKSQVTGSKAQVASHSSQVTNWEASLAALFAVLQRERLAPCAAELLLEVSTAAFSQIVFDCMQRLFDCMQ